MNTVVVAIKGEARARFNIGHRDIALPFVSWLSVQGWQVHMTQTREAVYLDELERCWNATLCEQYGAYLERRKVVTA